MTTEKRVHDLLVEHLGVAPDRVVTDARLGPDLGADSLDVVEIDMALEEEFGIVVADELITDLSTVAEVVAVTERLMAEGTAS